MKPIDTGGISWIKPVPGGTAEWYFGIDYTHGDLYEAEELFRAGRPVLGRSFCLVRYPDGTVFRPLPKEPGTYCEEPVFLDGAIYLLRADFPTALLSILRFDCGSGAVGAVAELPLSAVRDCYNLKLHTAPLCLTRQGGEGVFEILWPERRLLFVSGTASIQPNSHDVAFVGDIEKQVDCTMKAVYAILESRGYDWKDVSRAIVYLKEPSFRAAWQAWLAARGLPADFAAETVCDVCRDEWLFEIELDAVK